MNERYRICLVTSGNVASNPRLFKEASALQTEGYSVRIVAADIIPSLRRYDDELFSALNCDFVRISWARPRVVRLFRSVRQCSARFLARLFKTQIPLSIASRAHHALTPALAHAAAVHPADLYLAHNLAALPAAATAAAKHGAKLGFDAEDYHCGELPATEQNQPELRIRRGIEARLLPKCPHLTSASSQISEAYASDYGVKMVPILNVFPLSEAPAQPVEPHSSAGGIPALYWFSQTIGPNRGLEEFIAAMGKMRTPVRLLLRGNAAPGFIVRLRSTARRSGGDKLADRIEILDVAAPGEMVRLAAGHDLGLSIEQTQPPNRGICLTNKAFTYLLAGLPVVLSNTPAQTELARELGCAALLINLHNLVFTANTLDSYFVDRRRQTDARREAWRIARTRFNWDVEQHKFLASVAAVLQTPEHKRVVS